MITEQNTIELHIACQSLLTLSLPRSHLKFSFLSAIQLLCCSLGEFGVGST